MTTILTADVDAEFIRLENVSQYTAKDGSQVDKAECVSASLNDMMEGEFMAAAFGKSAKDVEALAPGSRVRLTLDFKSNRYTRRDGNGCGWWNSVNLRKFSVLEAGDAGSAGSRYIDDMPF